MVFFMNPHFPYAPKKIQFDTDIPVLQNVVNYDSEIFEADEQVGRILDQLKSDDLMNDTIFVFSTDHGEDMMDHGEPFHGKTLFDTTLNVPLLIHGLGAKGRFEGLVREIDLMPTLLDYVGVKPSPQCQWQMAGTSIRSLIERRVEQTGMVAYAETSYDQSDCKAKRTEERKVIADFINQKVQVYNLVSDPQELNNLVSVEPDQIAQWSQSQWKVDKESPTLPIDEDLIRQLKAVGYLGGE